MASKILLTTVFKPFGVDDKYGRKENIPELLASQVTRVQGVFSPRIWIGNAGIHLIAANCGMTATVLEWPSLEEFENELKANSYDFVGISFIPSTTLKMIAMVEKTRKNSPKSRIILGGFGTVIPDLEQLVDVEYICRGEGIRFIRNISGQSAEYTFTHPVVTSKIIEFLGLPVQGQPCGLIATGLGCKNGCDFCITSSFYECKYLPFLSNGKELYDIVTNQVKKNNITDFWIMDENFLQNHERALQFHEIVRAKPEETPFFNFDLIFSSSENINFYEPRRLAEMGITTIWLGYESKFARYNKNKDINVPSLVKSLAEYGITTLLSSVLFFDFHTPQNLQDDLNSFYSCGQAYSQILPLCSFPNTPLYRKLLAEERIVHSLPWEDRHMLNSGFHIHKHFPIHKQKDILLSAFKKEYELNGPSVYRILKIRLAGYKNFQKTNSQILRKRASYLRERLEKDIVWLVATKNIVTDAQRIFLEEIVEEMKAIFGSSILDNYREPIRFYTKKVDAAVKELGRDNMRLIQPECRKTVYN